MKWYGDERGCKKNTIVKRHKHLPIGHCDLLGSTIIVCYKKQFC